VRQATRAYGKPVRPRRPLRFGAEEKIRCSRAGRTAPAIRRTGSRPPSPAASIGMKRDMQSRSQHQREMWPGPDKSGKSLSMIADLPELLGRRSFRKSLSQEGQPQRRSGEFQLRGTGSSRPRSPPAQEVEMSDDRLHRGEPDRSKINMSEDHEVRYWTDI
jgi:hypothetical protein